MAGPKPQNKAANTASEKKGETVYTLKIDGKKYVTGDRAEALNRIRTQGAVLESPKEI